MATPKDDQNQNDKQVRVQSDFNLESWPLFARRGSRGQRVLKRWFAQPDGQRVLKTVRVGVEGCKDTITGADAKLLGILLILFYDKPPQERADGKISFYMNDLLGLHQVKSEEKKNVIVKRRIGGDDIEWFKERVRAMRTTILEYEDCYVTKDAKGETTQTSTESFTLISHSNIFERKEGKDAWVEKTEIILHPRFVESLLNSKTKPVLPFVMRSLRSDFAVILYRYVDLVMADKEDLERNLEDLLEELVQSFPDKIKERNRIIRSACAEIQDKDLTTGRLTKCCLEKRVGGVGLKFVFHKTPFSKLPPPKIAGKVVTTIKATDSQRLVASYKNLERTEKIMVCSYRDDIMRRDPRYGIAREKKEETAFQQECMLKAISRFLSESNLMGVREFCDPQMMREDGIDNNSLNDEKKERRHEKIQPEVDRRDPPKEADENPEVNNI